MEKISTRNKTEHGAMLIKGTTDDSYMHADPNIGGNFTITAYRKQLCGDLFNHASVAITRKEAKKLIKELRSFTKQK